MKALLFLAGVALVAGVIRRRDPEQGKRDRGAYPYHDGPFA